MSSSERVSIREIVRDLDLKVVYMPENKDYYVYSQDINRPGLQFAGYFEDFAYERIQIVGKTEYNYFSYIDEQKRREVLDKFFAYEIPVLIVSRNLEVKPDVIEFAKKYDRIVLSIGKSETALELIQRGHRLVADDAVEIRKLDDSMLVGQAPELLRHFMEIRGLGIIDVKSLYGVGATKTSKMIDLVINLEGWDENKYYDRLGLDREYEQILGVNIEKLVVPVKPGRNTSMVLEVAAMNYRQRGMGYDSAHEFTKKLSQLIDNK